VHGSARHIFKVPLVPYLVHGVLGDDLDSSQGNPQVHERHRYRPQGYDCQDAYEWVDPYSRSLNGELKQDAKSTKKKNSERLNRTAERDA